MASAKPHGGASGVIGGMSSGGAAVAAPLLSAEDRKECVKVVVRCRPLDPDKESMCDKIVEMDTEYGQILLHNPRGSEHNLEKTFRFDRVFDWDSTQKEIYDHAARRIVDACFEGYNGTIFCYGQTGSGKTFTMAGDRSSPEMRGIIPNAFDHIFSSIQDSQEKTFLVRVSYLEIYNEEIQDLAKGDSKSLLIKEHTDGSVYVKGLSAFICKSVEDMEHVMKVGEKNRHTGATNMNLRSSRSHSIFTIVVECSTKGIDGEEHVRVGKLHLVDLAGSEKLSKTGAEGQRRVEGAKINLSLAALGNVISALVNPKSTHIPYRNSKLTRLLQDSLGGNTKTVMIANIGPADYNYAETFSTLHYANRAKNLVNKPRINEDPKDTLLRQYQEEIERLKTELQDRQAGHIPGKGKRGALGSRMVEFTDEMLVGMKRENEDRIKKALQDATMTKEEQLRMAQELESRNVEVERERKARLEMQKKLAAMEEAVVKSGESLLDEATRRDQEIRRQQEEIERKREEELLRAREFEKHETKIHEVETQFETKMSEIHRIDAKLKGLEETIRILEEDKDAEMEQAFRDREEFQVQLRRQEEDKDLLGLIIDAFLPTEEVDKVLQRAIWREDMRCWVSASLTNKHSKRDQGEEGESADFLDPRRLLSSYRPKSASKKISPMTASVQLDLPDRTTKDYFPSGADLDGMYYDDERFDEYDEYDEDGFEDSAGEVYLSVGSALENVYLSLSPKRRQEETDFREKKSVEEFPEARGLVGSQKRLL
eukprot:TRINITY_DN294_c0_g3_i2.p1 TRINITY_DN294_c0_g3~~TRINITY_DN294_c0_g3_i2.p1  ORF type:complete len:768 (-),score=265.94 TRINITY_DN294_c0_g3_i2:1667-3970(-)